MNIKQNWHALTITETLQALGSGITGLSQGEAEKRLAQFGPNELVKEKRISPWTIWMRQFKNIMILILLFATGLSVATGDIKESIVIGIILIFATTLGFIQEYRAERAMEALKKMAAPIASVLRDGNEEEIPARELVPGDVIFLRTGDRMPADARLIEVANLKAEEAPLTGESVPIEKTIGSLDGEISVGDRKNMVFMGTAVVHGRGKAVVTATGAATEFGKIAGMLQQVTAEPTPLQVNLDRLAKIIGIIAIFLCVLMAGFGILRGFPPLEMIVWGIALAVAFVPEALPAIVVIGLAIGVRRMVKRNALIRKLPAVETLGCTTYICSDKTGTLTQDQMTVRRIYVNGGLIDVTGVGYEPKGEFYLDGIAFQPRQNESLQMLLNISTLCNDASLVSASGVWEIRGDPTEGALVVAAAKAGLWQKELASDTPRTGEIPFSSETKRMATVHQAPQGKVVYSKGAPEVVLRSCSHILNNGQETKLTTEESNNILSIAQEMAGDALRVLGIAYGRLPDMATIDPTIEQDMVFVGLVGMIDPPRQEAKEAVKLCDQAGIKSVMITGDHKLTAVAVAKELGILKQGIALTGVEIDSIGDAEFENLVEKIEVYARVSPAHKLRVVEALTNKRHVVAMTGDGVNDAPALKKADIGIAMGITGTDVTKEAADMVLTDDNFASIVAAVEEGRGVFGNIKKYLMYLLSSNVGEVILLSFVMFFGTLIGLPPGALPLVAIQILWINVATDGLPAIALSVDPPDQDIMRQKPRARGQGIFTKPVVILMIIGGIWSFLVNLGIFVWALEATKSLWHAQTYCFLTLVIIQFFKAYNFRSDTKSIFQIGLFKNKWLNIAICWEIILILIIVYTPFLQQPFRTFSLSVFDWALVILLGATIFPVLEITKAIIRWRDRKTLAEAAL
ncbi:MAG: cation-translocating P-type ATPase [Chloroflexi bacterium]|nr:cation-translocating P-type ATPase [Chloroflexota bacterium]